MHKYWKIKVNTTTFIDDYKQVNDKLPINFKIWLLFNHTNIFWVLLRVEHIHCSFTKFLYYYYVPKAT